MAARKDANYETAWLEFMKALNVRHGLENDIRSRSMDDLRREMQAEREHDRAIRESKEASQGIVELAVVCGETISLRTQLTSSDRNRRHEIRLLRNESRLLREKTAMAFELFRVAYSKDIDRLYAEARDVRALIKRLSVARLAAIADRDRIKTLAAEH